MLRGTYNSVRQQCCYSEDSGVDLQVVLTEDFSVHRSKASLLVRKVGNSRPLLFIRILVKL
jgi:hypothetical protein